MAVTFQTEVDTLIHYDWHIRTSSGLTGENAAAFVSCRFIDAEREFAARKSKQSLGATLISTVASVLSGKGISGAQPSESTVEQIAETKIRDRLTESAELRGIGKTFKLPPRKFALD